MDICQLVEYLQKRRISTVSQPKEVWSKRQQTKLKDHKGLYLQTPTYIPPTISSVHTIPVNVNPLSIISAYMRKSEGPSQNNS